jgi:formylglycine-generating enzyme required for sulfatase activity
MLSSGALFLPTSDAPASYTVSDLPLTMIDLPGREAFWMGSASGDEDAFPGEYPQHQVALTPFALAQFPVTQGLWGSVLARARVQGIDPKEQGVPDNPSRFRGASRPVEQVNWHEARNFCTLLNKVLQLPPNHFRLPSEAEWEYAARAGKPTHSYAGSNQLEEVGWYRGNNYKATAPVGLLAPNAFGLYDLSGNVWEWCEDDWHGGYDNAPDDGSAWVDDPDTRAEVRVLRGGSWINGPRFCRCAYRYWGRPDFRDFIVGFRLAAPVR